MFVILNPFTAFFVRDLKIEKSYRVSIFMKALDTLFLLAIFFFVARYFKSESYFPFVFTGIIFSKLFQFWLGVFSENIRQEQYLGTMEQLFLSHFSPLKVIFSQALSKFVFFLVEFFLYFVVALVVFKLKLKFNVFDILLVSVLSSIMFSGLGLISGALIMYFKKGDPVNWLIAISFDLLSGVYFSTELLPEFMNKLSKIIPTLYALRLWRDAFSQSSIKYDFHLAVFALVSVVFLASGFAVFGFFFEKAKINGELSGY